MQMPATTGYPVSYQPQYEQMTDRALLLLLLLLLVRWTSRWRT
jgi:hypothetical protein